MIPRLPRRAWPLWLAGAALWLGLAPLWSIARDALPFKAKMLAIAAATPAVALLIAPFLVCYRAGGRRALVWRARGLVPVLLSFLAAALTGLALLLAVSILVVSGWWRGLLALVYWAAWALYLQALRAAAVHRGRTRGDERRLCATFG